MRYARVVAAVVSRGRSILITRRPDRAGQAGLWEFPGGKVEPGEGEAEALARELREELGVEAAIGRLLLRHRHRYPDLEVALAFYAATLSGEPEAIGVAELAWAERGTLGSYDFLEADLAVLPDIERLA